MTIFEKQMRWYEINGLTPRPTQIEVAQKISDNWNKKFHIVDAPTGVGKAFIAMAASYAAGKSFILTNTKQLQDQYIDGPGNAVDLRGKANYKCSINPTMTAGDAPCISFPHIVRMCKTKGICPYVNQKNKALKSKAIISNYAYFLLSKQNGPFKEEERDLLVADEAHLLENQLINFAEFTLDPDFLKKEYGIHNIEWVFTEKQKNNIQMVDEIACEIIEKGKELENNIKAIFVSLGLDKDNVSEKDINNIPQKYQNQVKEIKKKLSHLENIIRKVEIYNETKYTDEWVISSKDNILTITPLQASALFFPFCVSGSANKFLFLSATIGSFEAFIEELGIPKNSCNFISTQTTFKKEQSPIIHLGVGKFNYKEIDDTLPKALKVIDQILNDHSDDKGIIHSTSYKITNYIAQKSKFNKRFLHKNMGRYPVSNNVLLEKHANTKQKTVLLSPSMGTGVSLDDDLARFQIIIKLPFLSMADERVKRKMKISAEWYRNKMWQEIMQSSGRATRSDDDYCITYILDASLNYFYRLDKDILPKWFTERIEF